MPFFVNLKLKNIVIYISLILLCINCAQITPLTGGKVDTTPPKAINYIPKNASVNFNQKTIEIEFNEFIALKDVANQFIITPQTNQLPIIEAIDKKIKIIFKEELHPNTTYKLSFGNSIVDIRESNAIQNFEYVFSTGSIIDSLAINGNVVSANNNKPASNILVGLYLPNSEDSIVFKEKPLYISKTNVDGKFSFRYLPNSPFKIIAIKDDNKNLMYDGSIEEIAFNINTINPADTIPIQLKLFKEKPAKQFLKKTLTPEYGKAILIYNIACDQITKINAKGLISYSTNPLKDSLTLYYTNTFDTLNAIISYKEQGKDTVLIKIPSEKDFEKIKKAKGLKYYIKPNINGSFPYFETLSFELNTIYDIHKLNINEISLLETLDSIITKKEIEIIENKEKKNTYYIKTNLKEGSQYSLTFNKAVFKDDIGRVNDSINFKFNTTLLEDYGKLNLKLTFPKKDNYLIFLLNEKDEIVKKNQIELSLASSSTKIIEFYNVLPGKYFIKIIEDANKNNTFDTGNFLLKKQSEIIYFNNLPIKILAGWEIENEWIAK
jgi:hypothetical protein